MINAHDPIGWGDVVKLRVVAYNVRSLRDDAQAVARVLRTLAPDIACIQEAPRFWRWRSKCARLARTSGLYYVGGGGTTGGPALFTSLRVDVRDAVEYRFSRTPRLVRRGTVAARIQCGGVTCGVATMHLGLDPEERQRHRRELVGVADRYGEDVTILAGDVNETPGHPTWQALTAEFTDCADADDTPTFSAQRPDRRIDGIFVRGPARVLSYRVVDDADVRVASDHRPVVAELELSTATE